MLRSFPRQLIKAITTIVVGGLLLAVALTTISPTAHPYYETVARQRAAKITVIPDTNTENDTNAGTTAK